jgi:acyl phosphate:glycerol-3-phosphate acyltransferase
MSALLLAAVLAYGLGTVMGGVVIGRLRGGVDLRRAGSGNVGATNALRTQGLSFALGVLLIDVLKGVVAVGLLPRLPLPGAEALPPGALAYVCGVAVTVGHCYPLWQRFQGGKGVATLAGVFLLLLPLAFVWMMGAFVLVVLLSGYVSLATLMAALVAVLHVTCFSASGLWSMTGAFVFAMALLVFWKHRSNLVNLARGREHRFEKARVLGRWLSR